MSNLREIAVILTPEQAAFMKANCDKNIEYALGVAMKASAEPGLISDDALVQLVRLMEEFKGIKQAITNAGA